MDSEPPMQAPPNEPELMSEPPRRRPPKTMHVNSFRSCEETFDPIHYCPIHPKTVRPALEKAEMAAVARGNHFYTRIGPDRRMAKDFEGHEGVVLGL